MGPSLPRRLRRLAQLPSAPAAAPPQQVRAVLGVRIVWVSSQQRRQGVAGRLLDCARAHAVPGYVAARAQVAYSQPTAEGAALAARYTGAGGGFLVYGV
jgi:N-acetyltransferase